MTQPFRLMSHNPQWAQEFEQSKSSILQASEGWLRDVQHIGSTCLPASVARPVIDMLGGIADLRGLNDACLLIEGLNFTRVATPDWCEQELCAMLLKPRSGAATHSVLVVKHQGLLWHRCLAIREHLASHWDEWQRLLQIKLDHFQPGCAAASDYETAKERYFDELDHRIAEN